MKDLICQKKNCRTNNLKESKADFTVREVYLYNISKGTSFILQGMFVFLHGLFLFEAGWYIKGVGISRAEVSKRAGNCVRLFQYFLWFLRKSIVK